MSDREYRGERESTVLSRWDGWEYIRFAAEPFVPQGVAAVAEAGAPAIGAYVVDSDEAAIYCASPRGELVWLAINPPYESEAEDPEQAAFIEAHDKQWSDSELHRAAAAAVARWSAEHAPKATSGEAITEALAGLAEDDSDEEERRILLVEDGLRAILTDLMGFASLDEAVFMVEAGHFDD